MIQALFPVLNQLRNDSHIMYGSTKDQGQRCKNRPDVSVIENLTHLLSGLIGQVHFQFKGWLVYFFIFMLLNLNRFRNSCTFMGRKAQVALNDVELSRGVISGMNLVQVYRWASLYPSYKCILECGKSMPINV